MRSLRVATRGIKRFVFPEGLKDLKMPWGLGRGLTIELDPHQEMRLLLGLYEIELVRHIRRMARPGIRCFDVGGQYGYDAVVLAKLTGAQVVSFEADAELVRRMRRTFALNPRLEAYLTAVEGFVGTGAAGTISLDSYGAQGRPGLLKIDVDGGELDVLRGADTLLRELQPAVILETHSPELERECGALLVGYGYRPVIINQRSVLPDWRPIAHNRWLVADSPALPPSHPR